MTDMETEDQPDIPAPLSPEHRQELPSPFAAGGGRL